MASVSNDQEALVNDVWGTPALSVRLAESFDEVVALNPELRIEQNALGEVILMAPTGGESGFRNLKIGSKLEQWAESHGGLAFDSSTLFRLPNGAKRSPDASWVTSDRWNALPKEERKKYPPLCPDFVIELRSETDRLDDLQAKMQEYVDNGIRLGWLIDPLMKRVHVYRPSQQPELRVSPESISGEETLPGFVLDLRTIWLDS